MAYSCSLTSRPGHLVFPGFFAKAGATVVRRFSSFRSEPEGKLMKIFHHLQGSLGGSNIFMKFLGDGYVVCCCESSNNFHPIFSIVDDFGMVSIVLSFPPWSLDPPGWPRAWNPSTLQALWVPSARQVRLRHAVMIEKRMNLDGVSLLPQKKWEGSWPVWGHDADSYSNLLLKSFF